MLFFSGTSTFSKVLSVEPSLTTIISISKFISEKFSLSNTKQTKAFSIRISFDSEGKIKNYKLTPTLIKVSLRLTYEEADEILDFQPKEEKQLIHIYSLYMYILYTSVIYISIVYIIYLNIY